MALKKDKLKRNLKKQGPIVTIIFLCLVFALVSFILNLFKVSGNITEAGTLETSIVTVNNIFSKEGIKYLLNNSIINFSLMDSIIYIIMSLMAVSILEASGLLKHILRPLTKIKSRYVTLIFIFIGITSTILGDYSYALLIPLAGVAYKLLGKNPALGIITMFIGLTIGYGVGIVPNYQDYMLGLITTKSATSIDASYNYHLFSTFYISIVSVVILTLSATFLIEKLLVKKFLRYDEVDKYNLSKKALYTSLIVGGIILAIVIYSIIPGLPLSGILLNDTYKVYIARLFGTDSAFGNGFMLIIVGLTIVCSYIYGRISGNIRNSNDTTNSLTKSFENTGYIFVLLFFSSIMIGLLEWSNIGSVIATNIVDFIGSLNFGGVPLLFVVFISIIIISILVPTTLTKWNLIAPIFVPILMRANITPSFAQAMFAAGDAAGKLFSPIYIYLIITIGFLYKHDSTMNTSIFSTMKKMMPTIILLTLIYFVILIGWYLIGLPLGFNTSITM